MDRRVFLGLTGGALAAFVLTGKSWLAPAGAQTVPGTFPVTMSDEEWKKKLPPESYRVLRQQGTEMAFTSPLNGEHRRGIFSCMGCATALFSSDAKFDSGTGWPSFFQPLKPDVIQVSQDNSLGMSRDEVHCATCGGHLGHVFNDGPKPTGLRYCMNGAALTFQPA